MRAIDEGQLEAWDKENANRFGPKDSVLDESLIPTAEDAVRMGVKRTTPID